MSRTLTPPWLLLPLCVLAVAAGSPAQAAAPRLSAGLRAGPLMGRTDLTDRPRGFGEVFARGRLRPLLEAEVSAGYGRLAGEGFATDLALGGLRLVLAAPVEGRWQPLVWTGLAAQRHDIAAWPPSRTGDARSIAWSAGAPVGLGARRRLGPRMALEVYANYTYTLRDDLDGRASPKGNDWLLSAGVGLVFGRFGPAPGRRPATRPPSAPTMAPPAEVDRDGDGLSDRAETQEWFTNPVMADSDQDGLTDAAEVLEHHTNPNRLDTDGDGVWDGAEVEAGTDPRVAEAPAVEGTPPARAPVPVEPPAPPRPEWTPAPFHYPTISFASGGAALDAGARAALDQVARHLLAHPTEQLEVRGYSDAVGSWQDNLRLAGRRCGAVRDYLVERGVDGRQLGLEAFGAADPVGDNDTEAGRRANRRVELVPLP
ncbi:MAG: OmpA family protein [Gemmatimonadota bacterium]